MEIPAAAHQARAYQRGCALKAPQYNVRRRPKLGGRPLSREEELAAIERHLAARGVSKAVAPPPRAPAARSFDEPAQDRSPPDVLVWTDGSCIGNPGPGGWGAILQFGEHEKQITGSEARTTNNQMELLAVIRALEAMKRPGIVVRIHTDSMYVIGGMTKGSRRRKAKMQSTTVPNAHLWTILDAVAADFTIQWRWVRGHAGDPMNERADRLAQSAAARQR